ncbi:MAG: hypothetical protein EAZ95_11640 [Bacteroidetes bacterium]|nr:MAG: hypothetical protein EAZ95_11640 [Bacteroidota bacterium]
MIFQSFFTTVSNIKPDKLAELRHLLDNDINADLSNNKYIPFSKLPNVHYCRWCIVDSAKNADGSDAPPMLLFQIIFDGKREAFIKGFLQDFASGIDKIYQYCEDYPTQPTYESRYSYFRKFRRKEPLAWTAVRGGTVEQILKEEKLRRGIEVFLDKNPMQQEQPETIQQRIKAFVSNTPEYQWAMTPPSKPSVVWKLAYYSKLVLLILCGIVLSPLILVFAIFWVLLLLYYEKQDNKHIMPLKRELKPEVLKREDLLRQNQLTEYGTFKGPHWFRYTNIHILLFVSSILGKYKSTKGNLGGIETIHFVSWAIFNKNQNLSFLSNYDGGWQSYLSEFIDFAASVMNLTFGNIKGYPKTRWLLKEGAHEEQNFKMIVRAYQYPCQIWYTAYPKLRVKNILRNAAIRKGLSRKMNTQQLQNWLKLF